MHHTTEMFTAEQKAEVILSILKEEVSVEEISAKLGVDKDEIRQWKHEATLQLSSFIMSVLTKINAQERS